MTNLLDDDTLAQFLENTEDGKMLLRTSGRFIAALMSESSFFIFNPHLMKIVGYSVNGDEKTKALAAIIPFEK